MLFTRELIENKLKKNDADFFAEIYNEDVIWNYEGEEFEYTSYKSAEREKLREEVKKVYYESHGDGNEMEFALHFPLLDIYVLVKGTYSSWDSNDYSSVKLAEPYEFKETRYRAIKK